MALTDHLKLRGSTYYVRVQIPPRLWPAAGGKREFVKTLKTGDLREANKRKHAYVAAFQLQIKALEGQGLQAADVSNTIARALGWRRTMEQDRGEVLFYHGDEAVYKTDEWLSQIAEEAEEIEDAHGPHAALNFFKIAKGEGTPLGTDLVDTWLAEQAGTITAQTAAQHRSVIATFLTWAGQAPLVEDVDRRKAGEFVSYLLTPASGLKRKTAQRYASSLASLWQWLLARGVARGENPWRGLAIAKKAKRGETPAPRQWSDNALKVLLTSARTERYTEVLHDLVRLAVVTGARLDELCALRQDDVYKRRDGWWFSIRQGKTEAAVREVPVHAMAAHVIERRRKSADGFLFEGLVPGGPDKKRSWNVSKAFGHYTQSVIPSEERQTFHRLRNTFTEAMEQAAVPESTTQLIIGHKRQSLTYGHYSQGERLRKELRDYINRLRYPDEIMRLIRGGQLPAGGRRRNRDRDRARAPGEPR
jgi:integrase